MFWTKRDEPTATEADREWVHEALPDILRSFGSARLLALPTFTPNTKHFPHAFDGSESDAEFVLGQVCRTMQAHQDGIDLVFDDDGSMELSGGIHVSPADRKGGSNGAAGTYQEQSAGRYRITLSTKSLSNLQGLISTIAHEVSHIKLLGERRLSPKDPEQELLTDLTVIAHGYGIFQGNSAFMVNQWQNDSYQGWQMQRTGYLPIEVVSYALALLAMLKKEEPDWKRYLSTTMSKSFSRNHAFLVKKPDIIAEARARSVTPVSTENDGA